MKPGWSIGRFSRSSVLLAYATAKRVSVFNAELVSNVKQFCSALCRLPMAASFVKMNGA